MENGNLRAKTEKKGEKKKNQEDQGGAAVRGKTTPARPWTQGHSRSASVRTKSKGGEAIPEE